MTVCHELKQLHVEDYDPSIIETCPLGVRLAMIKFRYPENEIHEGPYEVHLAGYVCESGEEQYV